jgi:uncharacterized protein (TIGR02996 family)
MTTEEAFLGNIAADRFNAAVRLIYADWLLEQGREDESYAWRWATARKLYPHLSPKGRVIAWTSDDHWNRRYRRSGLPRHVWRVVAPRTGIHEFYRCKTLSHAFLRLAAALAILRAEVAIL